MRTLLVILLLLFLALQFRLWFGDGGFIEISELQTTVDTQRERNVALKERNDTLAAEVKDLKTGVDAIEERARTDLGMIKEGETFYQTVEDEPAIKR